MTTDVAIADVAIERDPSTTSRLAAEFFGTFLLVFGVISAAIFSAANGVAETGIGWVGVSLAVGITVIAGAYAVGHISGGHFNPAVTVGAAAAGRFAWKDVPLYVVAQILGGILATTIVVLIASNGPDGFLAAAQAGGFASNGYGKASPGGFGLVAVIVTEIVATALFLYVILGVTDRRAPSGFAPLAIGLALTLFHLMTIPVSNASLNPARSIATAVFGGSEPLAQLWVFILAPVLGALIAGFTYKPLFEGLRK
ncbi:aquaporin Z [Pseudoclavibacter sp. JAI123]|uniref:aquaporin Z n=1 Tax=Pseudoclavibacter sp. JAI123 TaxID=2723065 RepID=UPI0015CDB347|nr:aquaporin Z [Pseudoclavibacter sp. JAI123]NYF13993.1 aquaporin Z [Pseudoclavibacter sp. JAI123]